MEEGARPVPAFAGTAALHHVMYTGNDHTGEMAMPAGYGKGGGASLPALVAAIRTVHYDPICASLFVVVLSKGSDQDRP